MVLSLSVCSTFAKPPQKSIPAPNTNAGCLAHRMCLLSRSLTDPQGPGIGGHPVAFLGGPTRIFRISNAFPLRCVTLLCRAQVSPGIFKGTARTSQYSCKRQVSFRFSASRGRPSCGPAAQYVGLRARTLPCEDQQGMLSQPGGPGTLAVL